MHSERRGEREVAPVRGRSSRVLGAIVVVSLLVLGLSSSLILRISDHDESERKEDDLAVQAGAVLDRTSRAFTAALAGAGGLVLDDGTVDPRSYTVFANGVLGATAITALAFEPVVGNAERAAFEAALGSPITEAGPDGAAVPAPTRDFYVPVGLVVPEQESTRSIAGFDIMSDPIRGEAARSARDLGGPVVTRPTISRTTGDPSFFIIQPLYRPGEPLDTLEQRRAAVVGFVSTAYSALRLLDDVLAVLPPDTEISIRDQDEVLVETDRAPASGSSVEVSSNGRIWTITAEQRNGPSNGGSNLIAIVTSVMAVAVGLLMRRNRRQADELQEASVSVARLAQLSELLAHADSRNEVAATVDRHAADIVGATRVRLRLAERGQQSDAGGPDDPAAVFDIGSRLTLPILDPVGTRLASLDVTWPSNAPVPLRARSTVRAIAEICEQMLQKAATIEARAIVLTNLALLGRTLAVAKTDDEVGRAIMELGPEASGTDYLTVAFPNEAFTALRVLREPTAEAPSDRYIDVGLDPRSPLLDALRTGTVLRFADVATISQYPALHEFVGPSVKALTIMPLRDSSGQLVGVLGGAYAKENADRPENLGQLETVGDLVAQTVERIRLFGHEHQLVVELQQRTLPSMPMVDGATLAARYLPASTTVGMGGDWYDAVPLGDGSLGVVIGDVAGHGVGAIADMTEFRTTISMLLRTSTDPARLFSIATELLVPEGTAKFRLATASLLVIDLAGGTCRYVRAGHLPTLLRTPDGTVVTLDRGSGPPIGVGHGPLDVEVVAVEPGTVLVLYTDGLVERRGEVIDVGIERLANALARGSGNPELLADEIIEQCVGGRQTDDDTALVVVAIT